VNSLDIVGPQLAVLVAAKVRDMSKELGYLDAK